MTQRKKKKLLYQLLSFILPFIILSILITSVILSFTNYNFFRKTIHQDYRNILTSAAGEISMFMDSAGRELESLAWQISSTKLEPRQKEISLTAFLHLNTQFVDIELYDTHGKLLISASPGGSSAEKSGDPIFNVALSGKPSVSGVLPAENDIPTVKMAAPVFRLGRVDEVLWAELNLKAIWDVLEKITIGKTGQVHILDTSGRTIAHREIHRVVKGLKGTTPEIINKVRNASEPVEWIENQSGAGVYHLAAYIPNLDWILVLTQPEKEIYAYVFRNLLWASLLTLVIGAAAVVFGWVRVRRFLAPIQTLHGQVREIGKGNLEQKVSVQRDDEIGELGSEFNRMTDSLRKYIDREVENAKALAHAKNLALLGTASSKMTHEVGNFLNNTNMALSGLKRESLSQQGENILKIIEKESGRVKLFIQRFLQFAKKPDMQPAKAPLDLVIREILEIVAPEADKKGIKIELNWDDTIPHISMDAGLMNQVFNNLVKNSMDAIADSGEIIITGIREEEDLVISVADTGAGMDPDTMENIFEPFFTTKGSGGTGLGMPIVRSNVEAHGGSISCTSRPGNGTEFIIRLPIR